MISLKHRGSFKKTDRFLKHVSEINIIRILNRYGQEGVTALALATPVNTGVTASSWSYQIVGEEGSRTIQWSNSNIQNGVSIAILLQYGHATRNGGYVTGVDYVNPAMKELFNRMAIAAWQEVTNA